MCSIGEDDFGDDGGAHAMVPQRPDELENVGGGGTCNKCGKCVNDIYKLCFRVPECRDCFLAYVRHKFRAALGSSKILPRGAKVLLVIDGSGESLVLLDMLSYAQTQNTHKRLHCTVCVLYVDESAVCQDIPLQTIQELQTKYASFCFYTIPLGAGFDKLMELSQVNDIEIHSEFATKLSKIRSLTSRQDYIKQRRKRLFGQVADRLQCGFIFMPTISTTLAAELLTAISLGRGGSAALDVALLDDRLCNDIKLVRPLKDLNEAEIQLYLRAQQLSPLRNCPDYGMDMSDSASLQNLTRAFVTNLQQNFSSTVSTVFRTGDKIAPNRPPLEKNLANMSLSSDVHETVTCSFCKSALDNVNSTTLLAIEFSGVVSEAGTTLDKCIDLEKRAIARLNAQDDQRLRTLCHACRNIQAEFSSNDENLL